MKKGAIIQEEIKVAKLVPGGQGLGTLASGQKVFLWNALPGETVSEIMITKAKRNYLEGVARAIIEPVKERIAPRDEIFLSTSPWQMMEYGFELTQKKLLLAESLRQEGLGDETVKIADVGTNGRDFYYRNKMEYSLYYDHAHERIRLAFHRRGSHQKVPTDSSSIEQPEILARAQEIVAELNRSGREAREFRALMLRANQAGEVSGGLLVNGQPHPTFSLLNDSLLGRKYHYSPNGFFQINLPVYEMALREIKAAVEGDKILDLYAGVGSIGLSVAESGQEVILVESNPAAGQELAKNTVEAKAVGIKAEAIVAKSEETLDYIKNDIIVIVDPPRAGLGKIVIERVLEAKPPKVIYLSCNPATQARDLAMLSAGYNVSSLTPFNFFPRTPHLEVLAVLELKKSQRL